MNVLSVFQVVVALGLLNVWLLRYSKETLYRGAAAKTLKEEFAAYGLPEWFHYGVGGLKIGSAIALIVGLFIPAAALGAASLVTVLMVGALAMHVKVKDPLKKSIPALLMLVMSVVIVWAQVQSMTIAQ
jgi:uncharacterized membrane protein YphA (DoxX/SURF4 family)